MLVNWTEKKNFLISMQNQQLSESILTGPIPESKGIGAIFSEKVQRNVRRVKPLKIWAKMYKI